MSDKSEFDLKTIKFQKELIEEALNKCTKEQQQKFIRIYGKVDLIKEDKIKWAYSIIERTLNKFGEQK